MARTRLVSLDDVPRLTELVRANRDFLTPWEPRRDPEHWTPVGQQALVVGALELQRQGRSMPHVILGAGGEVVGRVTLTNIVRGAFQSCHLGYWVAEPYTGRGLASSAVEAMLDIAFTELHLHRVEAGTLLHNVASQRVLERKRFTRIGIAEAYLEIDGRWQDHVLYQALAPDIGSQGRRGDQLGSGANEGHREPRRGHPDDT